jgi:anti-sigma B factor antagonist
MILTHQKNQDVDIVKISGRFVMADAPEARESFKTVIEEGKGKLAVDLSGVTFIDTSGLSVLISAYKLVRTKDGRMVLSGIPGNVQALLELTRLNEIFESFASAEAALAAMGKGS